MSEIEKGELVKAWGDNPSIFFVGTYHKKSSWGHHEVRVDSVVKATNCVELPTELVNQLENLGK